MTKKLLAILFAAMMLCSLLAGCAREEVIWMSDDEEYVDYEDETNEDEEKDTDKTSKSKKTKATTTTKIRKEDGGNKNTIDFTPVADAGANYDVSGTVMIAVNTSRPTDYQALFDVMEYLYPNVEIKYDKVQISNDKVQNQEYLTTHINTKTCADVMWDDASRMPWCVTQRWVYPLNDLIANDPEAKYIPANLKADYTYGGQLYAVPHQATFDCVAFNTTLLEKLGLSLPKLEWSLTEYEQYLRKAADKFSESLCVGNEDLIEQVERIPYYLGNDATPGKYSVYAYNTQTQEIDVGYLEQGVKTYYNWSTMMDGTNGKALDNKKASDGKSVSNSVFGVSSSAMWENGKSLIEDTGTYEIEKWTNLKFKWVHWPAPNTKGNVMAQIDQCFITSICSDANIDAAYQILRFLSFSTNGHLARLSMYEDSQKGKYSLNSHVYYPTSTNPEVLKKFKSLSCVTDADVYFLENIQNSSRFDAFKYIYDFHGVTGELMKKLEEAIQNPTGVNLNEVVEKTNKEFAASFKDFDGKVQDAQKAFDKAHK
jgi:ABC-type glycerol-3-phosphate transport system substrate-binding protein